MPHTAQLAEPGPLSQLHHRLKHHHKGGLITTHRSFSRTQMRLQLGKPGLSAGLIMDLGLELGHRDSFGGQGLSDSPIALYTGCSYWRHFCLNTLYASRKLEKMCVCMPKTNSTNPSQSQLGCDSGCRDSPVFWLISSCIWMGKGF